MVLLFVLSWGTSSCSRMLDEDYNLTDLSNGIVLEPHIFKGTVTKAVGDQVDGVESQMENKLLSLDVFFFGADQTNADFRKVFHLTSTNEAQLQSGVERLLTENWRQAGFRAGEHYDVYVVANYDGTEDLSEEDLTSINVLKSKTENEWTESCVWDDGSINPAALNLHKLYAPTLPTFPTTSGINPTRSWTTSKKFIMDGVVKGWTPVSGQAKQVIPVDMNRASAKFIVNIKFDEEFLHSLYAIKNDDGSWTEKDPSKQTHIDGDPGWRFLNFAYDTPVFDQVAAFGETVAPKPAHVLTSGALIRGTADYSTAADKHFTITTYSYPNHWEKANAMNEAPAIALSVGYKTGNSKPVYNYYRVPIVNMSTTTEIGRNKIYIVNATISAQGSTLLDEMEDIRVDYDVVDWVDPTMSGVDPSEVNEIDNVFLQVTPHTYILRGDGQQSVDLTYFLPQGYHIGIQYFTSQANNEKIAQGINPGNEGVNQTIGTNGVVTSTNTAEPAWYYNLNGDYMTSFRYSSNANMSNANTANLRNWLLSVKDNHSALSVSRGSITVNSTAMYNKAVKYIVMRVYLAKDAKGNTITDWYDKKLYRDIYIKHFPTDNVQNVTGAWSSKWKKTTTTTMNWGSPLPAWGDDYTVEENHTEYYTYAEYLADSQNITRDEESGQAVYNAISWDYGGYYDYGYYGEANAHYDSGYYYWYTGSGRQYTDYHRARYYRTGTVYLHTETVEGMGGWVDWDTDANKTFTQATAPYTYDGAHFWAKVWYAASNEVRAINVSNNYRYTVATTQGGYTNDWYGFSELTNTRVGTQSNMKGLNNNHMYVIQITRTSDTYVLGRPELDANNQSKDKVASPAFMIASQLGAVSSFGDTEAGAKAAANHCASYMEVGTDGTRYKGWRLPTDDEVQVIINYQGNSNGIVTLTDENGNTVYTNGNHRSMASVLTGGYYHSLDGTPAATGYDSENYAVRCVRDLSAEEITAINNQVENAGN